MTGDGRIRETAATDRDFSWAAVDIAANTLARRANLFSILIGTPSCAFLTPVTSAMGWIV